MKIIKRQQRPVNILRTIQTAMWAVALMLAGGGSAAYAYFRNKQMEEENDMLTPTFSLDEINKVLLIDEKEATKAVLKRSQTDKGVTEHVLEAHRIVGLSASKISRKAEDIPSVIYFMTENCSRPATKLACMLCIIDNARTKENIQVRYRQAVCVYYEADIEKTGFLKTFEAELPKIQAVLNNYDCMSSK